MVETLLCDYDSSSESSSSEEDDLETLFLDLKTKPKRVVGPRLNLEDLTSLECEQLFRLVLAALVQLYCGTSIDRLRNIVSQIL